MQMPNNILLRFLYTLEERDKDVHLSVDFSHYEQLLEISSATFKQHLKEDYTERVLRGHVPNAKTMFRDVFNRTRDLHKQGNINIFVCAPDVIAVAPFTIFDRFKEMRLFAKTESAYHKDELPVYMNDGPRYFPSTMDPHLWDLGSWLWEQPDPTRDQSQYIHNLMFYRQPEIIHLLQSEIPQPQYGYQFWCDNRDYNHGVPVSEAKVVHFHASRGVPVERVTRYLTTRKKEYAMSKLIAPDPSSVFQGDHREEIGGLWEGIGRHQFDFLLSQGMYPGHYLLDLGCGCLRLGVHAIPYLDWKHYCGMDCNEELVQSGLVRELGNVIYKKKAPRLVLSEEFDMSMLVQQPDFVMLQSVFTHFTPDTIRRCLGAVAKAIHRGSYVFATYFLTDTPQPPPDADHPHTDFRYTQEEMEQFGESAGLDMHYIGDWKHPRGQVIVRYCLKEVI